MEETYTIKWRWKMKEYKSQNRLSAKGIDLFAVAAMTLLINRLCLFFSLSITSQLVFRIGLIVYLIYEIFFYVVFDTTIGKWLCGLKYIRYNEGVTFSAFVVRVLSYLILFVICCEMGVLIIFFVYYIAKTADKFSGPFWDGSIKVIESDELYISLKRRIITGILLILCFTGLFLTSTTLRKINETYLQKSVTIKTIKAVKMSLITYNGNREIDEAILREDNSEIIAACEKALALGNQTAYVYTSYGNALYEKRLYKQAKNAYLFALDAEGYDDFILTMIGECYYELKDYEKATEFLERYDVLYPKDMDNLWFLSWSKALIDNNYIAGLDAMDRFFELSDKEKDAALTKIRYLNYFSAFNESSMFIDSIDPILIETNEDLALEALKVYTHLNYYEKGIDLSKKLIRSGSENRDVMYMLLDYYYDSDNNALAKNWITSFYEAADTSCKTSMDVAYMFRYNTFYMESVYVLEDLLSKSMQLGLTQEEVDEIILQLLNNYYDSDFYEKVIELCSDYKTKTKSVNLNYFQGISLFQLGREEEALAALQKALIKEDALYIYDELLYTQLSNNDYDSALLTLKAAKAKGMDSVNYIETLDYINNQRDQTPGKLIFDFIRENYLYDTSNVALSALEEELISKPRLSDEEFERINDVAFKEDLFSFIVYSTWFDAYLEQEKEASVTTMGLGDDVIYIKIKFFDDQTDTEFLKVLSTLEDTSSKQLIIDLRGNFGGDTESAFNILDYLVGTGYLGSWESPVGDDVEYFSDGNEIRFKEIDVLVDSDSASSSEIITLGIKEFVKNSKVVGELTYGKGVGQLGTSNLNYRYALFVVNAYWFVNDVSIDQVGIVPDIKINDGSLEDYLSTVIK